MQTGEGALAEKACETTVEIKNADGLHMRPAMQFVDTASKYDCELTLEEVS